METEIRPGARAADRCRGTFHFSGGELPTGTVGCFLFFPWRFSKSTVELNSDTIFPFRAVSDYNIHVDRRHLPKDKKTAGEPLFFLLD